MASIGGLFFIDEIVIHTTDGSPLTFPAMFEDVMFELGPLGIRGDLLFVFAVCIAATAGLLFVLYRSRLGLATRAVSQQDVAARLCGIGRPPHQCRHIRACRPAWRDRGRHDGCRGRGALAADHDPADRQGA